MNKYLVRANELMDEMVADRRHFHRFPELTNELPETTKYVRAKLEEMGYEVDEICKCGLVAIAGGKKPGKCILIRGDMDALPMPEETGLPAANVLIYALENGATVVVRPSGTEPKIKTYFTTLGKDLAEAQAQKDALAAAIEPILK